MIDRNVFAGMSFVLTLGSSFYWLGEQLLVRGQPKSILMI